MRWTKYWGLVMVAMLISTPAVFAVHEEAKGPEKFGRYEFKEQDIKAATDECECRRQTRTRICANGSGQRTQFGTTQRCERGSLFAVGGMVSS